MAAAPDSRPDLTTNEDTRDEVTALARGLTLLRTVATHKEPLSHSDLARLSGIPKATVSRLINTLVNHGFLQQLRGSDLYELAPTVLDLGNAYLRNFDLRTRIRPYLRELAEFAQGVVHLGVRDRFDMVLIDTIRPDSGVIFSRLDIGARLNLCTSAIGRAYLRLLPLDEREALLASARIAAADEWARVGSGVEAALAEAEQTGICLSIGEWHPLINSAAVGFVGPRNVRYAFNCGGPAFVFSRETLLEKIGPRMLECVRAIENEIGTSHRELR